MIIDNQPVDDLYWNSELMNLIFESANTKQHDNFFSSIIIAIIQITSKRACIHRSGFYVLRTTSKIDPSNKHVRASNYNTIVYYFVNNIVEVVVINATSPDRNIIVCISSLQKRMYQVSSEVPAPAIESEPNKLPNNALTQRYTWSHLLWALFVRARTRGGGNNCPDLVYYYYCSAC